MMRVIYIIFACFVLIPRVIADELPELGDYSATVMSPLDEQKIAYQIMRDVMASDQVIDDAEVNDYITQLGGKLAQSGPDKTQSFKFFCSA